MRQNEFARVLRAIRLAKAEHARLAACGPRFVIVHRFWQPGTICTPGEAVAYICLLHRAEAFSLRLSIGLMLLFDYLARHRHIGQSASLIAAGLNVDPFFQEHGTYANAHEFLSKGLSRTAVKQQIVRLRAALVSVFREAGLNLDVNRVLISEETEGNEVRYRLKISVTWEHFEL
jgi:hypothetical protein